jgi:Protein of unknown function (DUF3019)
MHQWMGSHRRLGAIRRGWTGLAAAVGLLFAAAALPAASGPPPGGSGPSVSGPSASRLSATTSGPSASGSGPSAEDIHLEINPRICTLTGNDKQCSIPVHAQWRSKHDESLCLVILEHKEIQRCWEHYSAGTYTVELVFTQDVVFQLRDASLEHVLASEALRVIREAIQYRHRRRQPWNIFD